MLSPPELIPVVHLGEGDDGVGDAGADVGPHDHRDRRLHRNVGCHQPHYNRGRGRRRLGIEIVKSFLSVLNLNFNANW